MNSNIIKCKLMNSMGMTPFIKMHGDEYFRKSWFGYKPIMGPDGVMSSGAMAHSPKTKFKRGDILTRRGSEYLPGWGTIAGNITMAETFDDFKKDLKNILSQPNVHGIFWVDEFTNRVEAVFWDDDADQIY